jgi:predicted amidohydrolase
MEKTAKHNLIPGLETESWHSWSPRKELIPDFTKETVGGETVLRINSKGEFKKYGKWICKVDGVKGLSTYKFSVQYNSEKVTNDTLSITAMLSWISEDGSYLSRDYIDRINLLENSEWKELSRIIAAPKETVAVEIELVFRWDAGGYISWKEPRLVKVDDVPHRLVRVATTFIKPRHDFDKNIAALINILDKAGKYKPDIICLSEAVTSRGLPSIEHSDTIPGRLTGLVAEKAEAYSTYVILNLNEKDGEDFYNTCVLIGRKGEILGKYRKIQLPLCEAEEGFTPGKELPVFDTDFGKIGIMICWDQWFPEIARVLRIKGAEIIFVPTIGYAPLQSAARAVDNGVYFVVAGGDGPDPSRILNPEGEIIGDINRGEDNAIVMEIDLDLKFYQHWLSVGNAKGEGPSIYLKERRSDLYGPIIIDK